MSYCLYIYAIQLDKLKKYCGSQDASILQTCETRLAGLMGHHNHDPIASGAPSLRMALKQLIYGEVLDQAYGFQYAYALKLLCELYGESLDNQGWSGIRIHYLDLMGKILEKYQLEKHLRALLYRGAPIKIPFIDEFPAMGYLYLQETIEIDSKLESSDFSEYEKDIAKSLDDFHSWAIIAKERHCELISFYH